MIWIHITYQTAKDVEVYDDKDKYIQVIMAEAMDFVNKTAGLNLTFNYPIRAHETTESYIKEIDVGGGTIMEQLNDTIICISDTDD